VGSERKLPLGARLAIRLLVPRALRDEVEGDLAERLEEIGRTRGARAAGRWLRWQLLSLARWPFRADRGRSGTTRGHASGWWWDLRLSARALRLRPAPALVVVLTIGVAVGATTSVFTVVEGVLLRPLPYPDADRLVRVWQTKESWHDSPNSQLRAFADRFPASVPVSRDWQTSDTGLQSVGAFSSRTFVLQDSQGALVIEGQSVTSGYFDALAVPPQIGRTVWLEDDPIGAPPVVVLSDAFWADRFGRDPAVLGTALTLGGTAYTVVGVMPPGFQAPFGPHEVWTTLDEEEKAQGRDSQFLDVVGRLEDGVSTEMAAERLATVQAGLATAYPDDQGDLGSRVMPLLDSIVGDVSATLWFLLGAVGLVLLVAVLNIANVLTVLGIARRREIAVKAALGAGSGRLVRSLFVENAVLAGAGGVLGILIAWAAMPALLALVPPGVPRQDAIGMSPRVLAFGLLVTAATVLAVGVLPALQAAGTAPGEAMRTSTRGATGGRAGNRLRAGMVCIEVAAACLLLVAAGLFANSFLRLWTTDRGFETEGVAVMITVPDPIEYPEREDRDRFVRALRDRLESIPGVDATATNQVPLTRSSSTTTYYVERPDGEDEETNVLITVALENYHDVLRIPLVAGRSFRRDDTDDVSPVAIVNQAMADRYWPGASPIGRRLRPRRDGPWTEVVGVVGNVRHQGLDVEPEPKLYVPATQSARATTRWVLRVQGDMAAALDLARREVTALSPSTPVREVQVLEESISSSVAVPRFRTLLVASLAVLAGALALIGLYGVVTFAVTQRFREIGVRMALGADAAGVVRNEVVSGVRLAIIGVAAGLAVAWSASDVLGDFLFGVRPTDPATYAVIAVVVTAVSGAAVWLPARKAASVDPVTVLNSE